MKTITPGLENTVEHILHDTFFAGASGEQPINSVVPNRTVEILALIRAEAINLADQMIGKDRIIHGEPTGAMNASDKAVYDYQVAQRIFLSKYQNPQNGPTGPEALLNPELSPNEE
jgi:hypothetical protein